MNDRLRVQINQLIQFTSVGQIIWRRVNPSIYTWTSKAEVPSTIGGGPFLSLEELVVSLQRKPALKSLPHNYVFSITTLKTKEVIFEMNTEISHEARNTLEDLYKTIEETALKNAIKFLDEMVRNKPDL